MKKLIIIVFLIALVTTAGFVYEESKSGRSSIKETQVTKSVIVNLSGRNIVKIPENIFIDVNIEELNLSNNALDGSLPSQIGNLKKLKVLNLSNNRFTGVPAEVGQLSNLEVLNLSNNSLTGLPYEIGNLSKLRLLDLTGNKYSEADLTIIKKKLPSTTIIKLN